MSLFFPLVFSIVCSLNFTNMSENIYGLWELCLQEGKQNHDERWFNLNVFEINPVSVPTRYGSTTTKLQK